MHGGAKGSRFRTLDVDVRVKAQGSIERAEFRAQKVG